MGEVTSWLAAPYLPKDEGMPRFFGITSGLDKTVRDDLPSPLPADQIVNPAHRSRVTFEVRKVVFDRYD